MQTFRSKIEKCCHLFFNCEQLYVQIETINSLWLILNKMKYLCGAKIHCEKFIKQLDMKKFD